MRPESKRRISWPLSWASPYAPSSTWKTSQASLDASGRSHSGRHGIVAAVRAGRHHAGKGANSGRPATLCGKVAKRDGAHGLSATGCMDVAGRVAEQTRSRADG